MSSSFELRCWRKIMLGILGCAVVMLGLMTSQIPSVQAINVSGIVNTYAPVTFISGTSVTIGASTGATDPFAIGDYALLIQMTGAPPSHGGSLGVYEMTTITGVGGSTITLASIGNTYEVTSQAVQLVRVPFDTSIVVTSPVTALDWNGATGGVVALKGDTLELNADIDATGRGFVAGTNTNAPWTGMIVPPTYSVGLHADDVTRASLSSGSGMVNGRGIDGATVTNGGKGGGGLGGGGGQGGGMTIGQTGGHGGGVGGSGEIPPSVVPSLAVGGVSGAYGGFGAGLLAAGGGGGGGGGGVIGGGGGGGGQEGGGGAGVSGGGGGSGLSNQLSGGGGGGIGSSGSGSNAACLDSCGGAGGGSYGGGGGSSSALAGGDDSSSGGGGGSWSGGGVTGTPGGSSGVVGGDGNDPVTIAITDDDHFLNDAQPRLILGGAGGSSGCVDGASGGGIILLEFGTVNGNSNAIIADGADAGATPRTCSVLASGSNGHGAGGAGGGAAGQMRLSVATWTDTDVSAVGGTGGNGNNNSEYHGGIAGAGGGGGGNLV